MAIVLLTVQATIGPHGSLEIHMRACDEVAEGGFLQGLDHGFEGKPAAVIRAAV